MVSLVVAVRDIKQRCAEAAHQGINYHDLLVELSVKPAVGVYIAKNFLLQDGFFFRTPDHEIQLDASMNILPVDTFVFAPFSMYRQAYGFETHEENIPNFQPGQATPTTDILASLGVLGTNGIVANEIDARYGDRKSFGSVLDKLVLSGVVIKRLVTPIEGLRSSRASNNITIYHLKRHAKDFAPWKDNLTIQPESCIRNNIGLFFRYIMDKYQIDLISTRVIVAMFQMNHRLLQYFRAQMMQLEKAGETLPIRFVEAPFATYLPSNPRTCGRFGLTWCLVRGPLTGNFDADVLPSHYPDISFSTFQHLSLLEQFDYRVNRAGDQGLTTGDIRKYTGYTRKRVTRISEELLATKHLGYGYPSAKSQEGKAVINRILPKYPVNVLIPAWLSSGHRQQKLLSTSSCNNYSSVNSQDNVDTAKAGMSTLVKSESSEISEEGPGLPTHFPTNAQISGKVFILQISRDAWILHFLSQQPYFVCSQRDIKVMVDRQMSERGSQSLVDKKTLIRCLQSLEERGLISSRSVSKIDDYRVRDIFQGRIPVASFYVLALTHPDAARFCSMVDRTEGFSQFVSSSIDDLVEQFLQHEHRLWFARGTNAAKASSMDTSDQDSIEITEEPLDSDSDSEDGSFTHNHKSSRSRRHNSSPVAKELFPAPRSASAMKRKRQASDEDGDSDEEYIPPQKSSRTKSDLKYHRAQRANNSDYNNIHDVNETNSSVQKKRRVSNSDSNNNSSSMENPNTDASGVKHSGRKRSLSIPENAVQDVSSEEVVRFVRLVGVIVKDEHWKSKASRKLQHAKKDGFVPLSAVLKQPISNHNSSASDAREVVASVKQIISILSESNASMTASASKKSSFGTEQSSSDEHWSLEEDMQLLERLVLSLCVRGCRLGLPILLKSNFWRKMDPHLNHLLTDNQYILVPTMARLNDPPSSQVLLVPIDYPRTYQQTIYRKDDFRQHMWDSCPLYMDLDHNRVDLTHLRSSYLLSKVIKTSNMSVSACRRHLPLLIKHLSQMSNVCSNPGAGGIGTTMMTGHLTLKWVITRLLICRGDISGFYLSLVQQSQSEIQPATTSKTLTPATKRGSTAVATKEKDYNTMNAAPFDALSFIDTIRFLFWQEQQNEEEKLSTFRDDRAQTILQRVFKNVEVPDFETKEEEEDVEASDVTNTFSVEDIAGLVTYGTPEVFEKDNFQVSGEDQNAQEAFEEVPHSNKKSRLSLRQLAHKTNTPAPQKVNRMPIVALTTSEHILAVQLLRDLYIHMVLVRKVGVTSQLCSSSSSADKSNTGHNSKLFHGKLHENEISRFRGTILKSEDDYNPLVTEFGFSPTFLQAMTLERPLGSFFYDYCKASFHTVSETARLGDAYIDSFYSETNASEGTNRVVHFSVGVSNEYRDASKLLHLATAMSRCAQDSGVFYQPEETSIHSSGVSVLPASQMGIALEVFGNIPDYAGADVDDMNMLLQQSQKPHMVVNELTHDDTIPLDYEKEIPENMSYARSNDLLQHGVTFTSNSVGTISTSNNRRACDRVVCHVQYEHESIRSDVTMRLLCLLDPALLPGEHQKDRPWVDVDPRNPGKYQYKIPALQYFLTQILAYLGENPGATVSHIHTLLMFLPLVAVQEMLFLFVQVGILEERRVGVSVALSNCFGAWDQVWGDCSNEKKESVFYEIAV